MRVGGLCVYKEERAGIALPGRWGFCGTGPGYPRRERVGGEPGLVVEWWGEKDLLPSWGGEAETGSSPFYFHILLPPVWVDGGVLVWLGLFCGRIGGLDDVPVSGAGQNAVHWIGPRFVNISFSAYRPRTQKWPPSPNTYHPFPLSLVCPRPQTSYLSENSSSTCLQLSGNRQGSTVYPPLAFFVRLFGAYGRIPVFCSRGLFCFSMARQIRPLPRYTLHIHPPKRFTGVSSTVSICPILDKTTYPGKISEQSKNSTRPNLFCPISQVPPKHSGAF